MAEPPDTNETDAPETFRADLLHQRDRRLNRAVRALTAFGVALLMLTLVGVAHAWRWYLGDLPALPAERKLAGFDRAPSTIFLDRYGRIVATRGPQYGGEVRLTALPAYVPLAFMAAQQETAPGPLTRDGAPRGVVQAGFVDTNLGPRGATTMAKQLARTMFDGPRDGFKGQLQEAILTHRLKRRLTRDRILEVYLNRAYFGGAAYGVDAAARTYFGKPAGGLTLAEAVVLAVLPREPESLDPARDSGPVLRRAGLLLQRMQRSGWVGRADVYRALRQPILLAPRRREADFGWALDMAAAEARARTGLKGGDLEVRLSLDPDLQASAAEIVRRTLDEEGREAGADQAAVVVLGPDGGVRALVGGRDHDQSPLNRAAVPRRPPGPALRPWVWAAALDAGAKPEDRRSSVPPGPAAPDGDAGAPTLTLTEALARSNGAVAERLTEEAGPVRIDALLRRFGLTAAPAGRPPPPALGADPVSVLQMAAAYQVLQHNGARLEPHLVEEVALPGGKVLYRRSPPAPQPVYDPGRTGALVKMMTGVTDYGLGKRAALDRPAAAFEGAEPDGTDAWFAGFTPDWLTAVWVGDDTPQPMNGVAGGDLAADIWRRVMLAAHRGAPVRGFGGGEPEAIKAVAPAPTSHDFYTGLAADFARRPAPVSGNVGP